MKKLKSYRAMSTCDGSSTEGRHIHFLHILAFARQRADFTEKENAHFDVCRACCLKVLYALRNVAPEVVGTKRRRMNVDSHCLPEYAALAGLALDLRISVS
jgi:hypothetical protein